MNHRIRDFIRALQRHLREAWFPIAIAGLMFGIFGVFGLAAGQVQEVLANYTDGARTEFAWTRALVSVFAILVFASTLRHWTARLLCVNIHAATTDGWTGWHRLFISTAWYAPWLGASLSFAQAHVASGGSLDWQDLPNQLTTHPFVMLTVSTALLPWVLIFLWWLGPIAEYRRQVFASNFARFISSAVLPLGFSALAAYFLIMPPSAIELSRAVGPVPIIGISLAVVTAVGCYLILLSRRRAFPVFTPVLLLPVVIGAFGWDDNHHIRRLAEERVIERPQIADAFYEFADASSREPIVLISAEGGGIRSAHFTAMVLSRLADHCPRLARRIFAISAVSGGAIGAAAYQASLETMPLEGEACDLSENLPPGPRQLALDDMLSRDHLSPTLAKMAFPELVQAFLPAGSPDSESAFVPQTDRQLGLELTFEQAYADAFNIGAGQPNPMERSVFERASPPHLIINMTRASTGGDYAASSLDLSGVRQRHPWLHDFRCLWGEERGDGPTDCSGAPDYRLSTIAATSARFPVISPAGTAGRINGHTYRFVDGGYFDNSGIEAMLAVVDHLRAQPDFETNIRPRLIILHIDANPYSAEGEQPRPQQDRRLDLDIHELQAVLAAREERVRMSFNELENLEGALAVCDVQMIAMDTPRDITLRLGWILSDASAGELQRQASIQLARPYQAGDLPLGACRNPNRPAKPSA
ncbi:MAG: patatin-like phospholipase family protein [Phycisphaerales bacterium]|nr:patatin-like phospholipase family protein [Hyphomonadaceae bacterium]